MKRVIVQPTYKVWLSANDTYAWAHAPNKTWPCSVLSGKSLFAEFCHGDLVDVRLNGKAVNNGMEIPFDEFNAIIEDYCGTTRPGNDN